MIDARRDGPARAARVWRLLMSLAAVALLTGVVLFAAGMAAGHPVATAMTPEPAVHADGAEARATTVSLASADGTVLDGQERSDAELWVGALPAILAGGALLGLGCWTLAAERARSTEGPRRRA